MNYAYALTRNAYQWALPSMRSLAEHDPKARVFILAEDDEFPYALPFKPEVINVSGQTWFSPDSINYNNDFSYINLLKVCYPYLLSVKKVIHLDADTILCDDPKAIWATNVTGKWVAACRESHAYYRPFGDIYYNMGVALVNLDQMRKDNIMPDMIEYLNTVKQPFADQDAWNKYGLGHDKFVPLDERWNECFATSNSDNPGIVHFCGIRNWYTKADMPRREYLEKYMGGEA